MKKLELVYIGEHTSRFEYGKLYRAISFNNVGIITFLDKNPYEMNKDILNKNFVTLSRFIKLTRDKKINEILE
jgi:hypothetical protein